MDDWQPIETAPKDGSAILCFNEDYTSPFVCFWGNRVEEFGSMPGLPDGSVIEKSWLLAGLDYDLVDFLDPLLYDPLWWKPL
jgi:hypothetical protein